MPLTGTTVAPTPTRPTRTRLTGRKVSAAAAASGTPKQRMPAANPPARRRRVERTATATAPATLPTPIAVVSQPKPALPAWSSRIASTTSSTLSDPSTIDTAAVSPTTTRSAGRRATDTIPAVSSGRNRECSLRSGGSSRRTCSTKAIDQRKNAPLRAKTAAGPLTTSSTPPSAGPTNIATLEIVLPTRFAAVSSSGVSTSDGRRAAWAGAYELEITVEVTASP